VSKNNTGSLPLRGILPVINKQINKPANAEYNIPSLADVIIKKCNNNV